MSLQNQIIAAGTTIATSPDGTTWTNVSNVVDIKFGATKIGKVDKTNNSNTDLVRRYKAGFREPGEHEIKVQWSEAFEAWLNTNQGVDMQFKLQYPDGTSSTTGSTDTFAGFVSEVGKEIEILDNKMKVQTFKIQQSGPLTVTAGS